MSGKHCTDWYPVQRGSSDGEIRKQIPTSSGRSQGRPSPRDIRMSQWPWARLERRAVCAERCPYGSGRRSAYALLTRFPTAEGWLYLAAVMDLFSRKIVGWAIRDHMRAELVSSALSMALRQQRPGAGLILAVFVERSRGDGLSANSLSVGAPEQYHSSLDSDLPRQEPRRSTLAGRMRRHSLALG